MAEEQAPIALTIGEPAGIGPDLILQLFANRAEQELPYCVLFGDPEFLRARNQRLGLDVKIAAISSVEDAHQISSDELCVIDVGNTATDAPGFLDQSNAPLVTNSIKRAVTAVHIDQARAVVTAPIHKANLYDAGFEYPGHTEFLASLCSENGVAPRPVMMLAHKDKRAIPVTIHIALKDVFSRLTTGRIVETVRVAHHDLREKFGIAMPRIGLTGLNPHAGEDGAMGDEEIHIIKPAIAELAERYDIKVAGPLPADTAFAPHIWSCYDVMIAMYHDQALIPVKAIGFDAGVNITLGLPIVRTSPDHGTALSLAGTGQASPTSMYEAIKLADSMTTQGDV
ncbi:4-hydroxythreonine-4-phosphate dehydrogenase PdxA [Maritalea sp.]|uniref:4-hydroxythreonine-4-phosphate dehydrogenase PdxA n=1 Tax=Maritalea sp. TaxID=2003361 RepID=UPI003EF380D5